MENETMGLKIGIVGAGAVGGVVSTILTANGYDVELCYRHKSGVEIDNMLSIDVVGEFGEYSQLVKYVDMPTDFTTKKDIIFIFTKAQGVASVSKICEEFLNDDGTIVIISNLILLDDVKKVVPLSKIVGAFIGWSSIRENNTKMKVTNAGEIIIGSYDEQAASKLEMVKNVLSSIAPTTIERNMISFIVSRVIINSAVCATGAISGMCLGKVLEDKYGRKVFLKLIEEAVKMFDVKKILLIPYNNQLDYNKFKEHNFSNTIYVNKMINIMQKNNYNVISSALCDLEKGSKTEIDYLSGKIADFGIKYGLNMEYTTAVVDKIHEIENGKFSIYETNLKLIVDSIEKKESN